MRPVLSARKASGRASWGKWVKGCSGQRKDRQDATTGKGMVDVMADDDGCQLDRNRNHLFGGDSTTEGNTDEGRVVAIWKDGKG